MGEIKAKEERIKDQTLKYKKLTEDVESKIKSLAEKEERVSALNKQITKKLMEYTEKQGSLRRQIEAYNQERDDFELYILSSKEDTVE